MTEVLVCMIWFLFTPLSVPGEREMLTDEGRQKSDEGLRRGVNELFPQAVLLTMRVSIEPLMTGGCSIAHTPTPPSSSSSSSPALLVFTVYCHPFLLSFCFSLAHRRTHTQTNSSSNNCSQPKPKQSSLRGQPKKELKPTMLNLCVHSRYLSTRCKVWSPFSFPSHWLRSVNSSLVVELINAGGIISGPGLWSSRLDDGF